MPKTYQDTAGKTYATHAAAAAGNTALGTNPQTVPPAPVVAPTNTPMSATGLSTPVQPVQVPKVTPQPTTDGLAMTTNGVAAAASADTSIEPPPNPAKDQAAQILNGIQTDIGNQAATEDQYRQDVHYYEKQKAADTLKAQLDQKEKDFNDKIAEMKLNPEGKTTGALQADIANETDKYNSARANIALQYSVAANDFTRTAQIVNDKIDSLRQQHTQQLSAYQLAVNAINNDLTESEKIQIQANLTRKQDQAKILQDAYTTALTSATQGGAPASVLSAIDAASRDPNATAASVMAAAGQYGTKVDTQVVEAGGRQLLIDSRTGTTIKDLGAAATKGGSSGLGGSTPSGLSAVTQTIVENPSLFSNLTPTVRGQVLAELQGAGYDTSNLGAKPLSDTAIGEIAQTKTALTSLQDLKSKLSDNKEFIGPISGFAALNPWSTARQVQADIDRVKQNVGKALEGGVLRKEDEDKYKKILATLNDAPETAVYKIDALIGDMERKINEYTSLQQAGGRSLDVKSSLQKKGETSTPEDLRKKYNY